MGSGSSTTVNPIRDSQSTDRENNNKTNFTNESTGSAAASSVIHSAINSLHVLEGGPTSSALANKVAELEKQIGCLESEKLDLEEQVAALAEQLEQTGIGPAEPGHTEECSNTVQAQDHYIHQLQTENATLKTEVKKLKMHYKKKLRLLNTHTVEWKQQSSLEKFELKDEIAKLIEENTQLTNQLMNRGSETQWSENTSQSDPGRNRVILDLSAKLAEQESHIAELQQQLADVTKAKAAKLQPVKHVSCKTKASSMSSMNPDTVHDLEQLKSIAQEIKLLQRHRTKKKQPSLAESKERDYRVSSGVSRDSGIISMETDINSSRHKSTRISSAASTMSACSYDDPHNTNSDHETYTPDSTNIRQISAYKKKKKQQLDMDIDYLLSNVHDDYPSTQKNISV